MARSRRDWTVREVQAAQYPPARPGAKPVPAMFRVSDGLYLQILPTGTKTWVFRYKMNGRARQMGLGPAGDQAGAVLLAEARTAAGEARRLMRQGIDPIEHRRATRAQAIGEGRDFAEVASLYLVAHEPTWRNVKHRQQWVNTLAAYVYPVIGALPVARIGTGEVMSIDANTRPRRITVARIGTGEVMSILEPLWRAKPETASRVRGRIEAVLDYAAARGWRVGENPARWRGHLANMLPQRARVRAVEHQPACDWREAPGFMAALAGRDALAARAIALLILTAARSGEVVGARWGEIDRAAKLWTVPSARMKAKREHRVPLAPAALALLDGLALLHGGAPAADAFLFPGARSGKSLSAAALAAMLARINPHTPAAPARFRDRRSGRPITLHGFRSTFRDWCAEGVAVPREVAEAALAHVLRDKVEAAYARADLVERRRVLMAQWAEYLGRGEAAPVAMLAARAPARQRGAACCARPPAPPRTPASARPGRRPPAAPFARHPRAGRGAKPARFCLTRVGPLFLLGFWRR